LASLANRISGNWPNIGEKKIENIGTSFKKYDIELSLLWTIALQAYDGVFLELFCFSSKFV